MSIFNSESNQERHANNREYSRESHETKEQKENEKDPELQKAAARERAELLVKEVKQNKQQMKNILMHVQQVISAIRQLRVQLQLADDTNDPSSIKQDKELVAKLQKQMSKYIEEIVKMRGDLIREQIEELKNSVGVGMSTEQLQKKATEMVDEMIAMVKGNNN